MTRRIVILGLGALAAWAETKPAAGMKAVRGTLLLEEGRAADPLRLVMESGETLTLAAEGDTYYSLHDPKLAQRTWEFEGQTLGDGRFDILKMFTIVDGKRHKVTYYCEVCHITSYRPGECMCCQDEVELQETPLDQ